jgi:hypothetical protein
MRRLLMTVGALMVLGGCEQIIGIGDLPGPDGATAESGADVGPSDASDLDIACLGSLGGFMVPTGWCVMDAEAACSTSEIQAVYSACIDPTNDASVSSPACEALLLDASCGACIADLPTTQCGSDLSGHARLIIPAIGRCMSLLGNDACGHAYSNLQLCADWVCSACSQSNFPNDDYDQCVSAAMTSTGGPCRSYLTDLSGCSIPQACEGDGSYESQCESVAAAFCLGAP